MEKNICVYVLNIQQIWIFPPNNWEAGFCFGFCNEDYWGPHCKTLAQLTSSDWKTEKGSSYKGKPRLKGKKNQICCIETHNNKFHGLSPSGGHHSLLFDQGFQKIAVRDWSERHLTIFCIDEIVPSYVVMSLNGKKIYIFKRFFHRATFKIEPQVKRLENEKNMISSVCFSIVHFLWIERKKNVQKNPEFSC